MEKISWRARTMIGGKERLAQFRVRYVDDVLGFVIREHDAVDTETGETLTHLVAPAELANEFRWRQAMVSVVSFSANEG
jgi:hypothetical protein